MARKTYPVSDLVTKVNHALAAPDLTPETREYLATLAEIVLHDTGNYRGFGYQSTEFNADGSGLRQGYDDTRRVYYYAK